MRLHKAIRQAEKAFPGGRDSDLRGERLLEISRYVDSHPEQVWAFIARWGRHESEDLRTDIGLYLLEHLLSYHFDLIFPRVEQLASEDPRFAYTFRACRKMGQAETPANEARWDALLQRISGSSAA
jgi:hypothetical protein